MCFELSSMLKGDAARLEGWGVAGGPRGVNGHTYCAAADDPATKEEQGQEADDEDLEDYFRTKISDPTADEARELERAWSEAYAAELGGDAGDPANPATAPVSDASLASVSAASEVGSDTADHAGGGNAAPATAAAGSVVDGLG